jgi:MoaA/NifB/PqqE/SkfB family radical SAM enzyme
MTDGSLELITGPRGGDDERPAPYSVDCRLTGACQLRCAWCWGPAHSSSARIRAVDWVAIVAALAQRGTRHVVFSGGEPTLSNALRSSVEAAARHGLLITLSTNGIRFAAYSDILGQLNEIGIPIDGSTPQMQAAMRGRSERHGAWKEAIQAIRIAQAARAAGESRAQITVRTVIARPNLQDIARIPEALTAEGIDLSGVRLKLYQVEPIGPHAASIDFGRWAVSVPEAHEAAQRVVARLPATQVTLQLYQETAGRYFLIDPDGTALGTDEEDGLPREVVYGNVLTDLDHALGAWRSHRRRLK